MSDKFGLKKLALFGSMALGMLTGCDKENVGPVTNPNNGNGTNNNTTAITASTEINVGSIAASLEVAIGTRGQDSTKKIGSLAAFTIITPSGEKLEFGSSKDKTVNVEQIGLDKITKTSPDFTTHYGPNGELYTLIITAEDLNKNGQIDKSESLSMDGKDFAEIKATGNTITFNGTTVVANKFNSAYDTFINSKKVFNGGYKNLIGNDILVTGYKK